MNKLVLAQRAELIAVLGPKRRRCVTLQALVMPFSSKTPQLSACHQAREQPTVTLAEDGSSKIP